GLNGAVTSLAIDPATPTTLYAGTDAEGVFKSTDAGGTWHYLLFSGLTLTLAVDPLTPSTLYMGHYGSAVFKSTDAGNTWGNNLLSKGPVHAFVIDPITP